MPAANATNPATEQRTTQRVRVLTRRSEKVGAYSACSDTRWPPQLNQDLRAGVAATGAPGGIPGIGSVTVTF